MRDGEIGRRDVGPNRRSLDAGARFWGISLGLRMLLATTLGCVETVKVMSGLAEAQAERRGGRRSSVRTADTIHSKIDGTFEGWDGDTIFKLTNGQVWEQASYDYHYAYAYRPDVIIWKSGSKHRMSVEGVDEVINVRRLR